MRPMTDRETATVLAALRLLQREGTLSDDLADIATDGDNFPALTDAEIDNLCDGLNSGEVV